MGKEKALNLASITSLKSILVSRNAYLVPLKYPSVVLGAEFINFFCQQFNKGKCIKLMHIFVDVVWFVFGQKA